MKYPLTFRLHLFPVFLLGWFFCIGVLGAAPLSSGDVFPEMKDMQDQHEKAYVMPSSTKHIAVAFTMSVGKSANKHFAAKGAKYLPESDAVFIANIYSMPAVGRLFAMPKMRKYPHRIMLVDSQGLLDEFPQKKDMVTVFDIDASGKILAIRYWDPTGDKSPF